MLAALIPAAGISFRMGRYKPLLPLGRTTMIGTVISLFKTAGIREIIVASQPSGIEGFFLLLADSSAAPTCSWTTQAENRPGPGRLP